MKRNVPARICIFLILILILVSCGQVQNAQEQESTAPAETPEPTPAPPETAEELRQAIAQLDSGKEALDLKRGYYEQLLGMDAFEEADYVALAQLYADLDEKMLQRDILSKVLRLYPSREYADRVSAIVVQENGENEGMAALAEQTMTALGSHDMTGLQELTGQEEWRRILQGGMLGIETRTRYCQGDDVLQIAADGPRTEITWHGADGRFCFYQGDETGAVLGEAVLKDGAYSGAATVTYTDGEGNILRSFSGTLQDGICVDQITVEYQGATYTGKLNADGTSMEEQYQKAADAHGVVYAYTADGKSYLYQEEAEPETFRLDAAYLGFPEYAEWR
nr:hypothetical protein [uncultured Acetatifactor sp.]